MADSRHFLNSEGLTYLWSKIKNYINANKGVGEDVSGQTFTIDETEVTAGTSAERFNDYTDNIATGNFSHAEGYQTQATGVSSHAEGYRTKATGLRSHAEGSVTTASGTISHAEGGATIASGMNSHAEGIGTIAASSYQHVQGRYNIEDANSTYAHIVGNGTSSTRANIHTLDWNGVAWYKGGVKVGGTSAADATELTPGIQKFTITVTEGQDGYVMDKTYAEVLAAYNNGDILELNVVDHVVPLQLVQSLNDSLIFEFASYNVYQGTIYAIDFLIDSQSINLIDDSSTLIPSKTSDLTNDAGFITSYTETDPTVPSWAKQSTKPTYTASEVGALPSNTTYVSSVNGSTGAITGLQTSAITDTGGYFTTDTVEAALQQIGAELDGVETLLAAI